MKCIKLDNRHWFLGFVVEINWDSVLHVLYFIVYPENNPFLSSLIMSMFPGLHPSLHVRVVLFAGAKLTYQCLLCMGLDPYAAVSENGVPLKSFHGEIRHCSKQ